MFQEVLKDEIVKNWANDFGEENHDPYRFGPYSKPKRQLKDKVKLFTKRLIGYKPDLTAYLPLRQLVDKYGSDLDFLYAQLNETGRDLLVKVIAYRILGPTRIKLPLNTNGYWELFKGVQKLMNFQDIVDPKFLHFKLKKINLSSYGYPIEFYFTEAGVVTDFIVEQYAYKENESRLIEAKKGDYVLDLGACWGDTALYFASKVGEQGKVFSFEFIPNNISIFNLNVKNNPHLSDRIILIQSPVSDISDVSVYYQDNGPGSTVNMQPFKEQTGETKTLTIDDFVEKNGLEKLDFIKMDIEGAEQGALRGAEKTIRKFKPTLAIAIYHSMDDIVNIPKWISNLDLGYKFYLGHYKIFAEETILFASL
jgi:FkbM family methyltransferase